VRKKAFAEALTPRPMPIDLSARVRKACFSYPEHFDGKRFFTPGAPPVRGLRHVLRWKLSTRPQPSPAFAADVTPFRPPPSEAGLRVTMVNHSTVLIQCGGCNILTDPVWSDRVSPFSWAGPRRRRAPGIEFRDLPRIDLVLLSHNHYDHCDLETLRRLSAAQTARFVTPVGMARLLRAEGVTPPYELDWGDAFDWNGLTVHCVPAQHFSGRGANDRNRSLWCAYMIETDGGLIYFAADTAFGAHFQAVADRFGPPRLALLPIGAYLPRWMMSPVHMDPDEAVQAHDILDAGTSIAIHHGTFQLADDSIDHAAAELARLAGNRRFLALRNGESALIE
jgi:L-ascorbate metabolism protein UlaG (beta-lactamase superfamily)